MNTVLEPARTPDAILLPWTEWPTPAMFQSNISDLTVRATGENSEGFGGRLTILAGDEEVGFVTPTGLQQLGHKLAPCPAEFILTLPTRLQAEVLNSRIEAHKGRDVVLVTQGEEFTNFIPSHRETLTYQETAQFAFDTLADIYGDDLTVDLATLGLNGMSTRFLTNLAQPVTRKVGDTLSLGIEVSQNYGLTTDVNLYLRRLVCLNGMTTMERAFSWQNPGERTTDHQRLWLADGIAEALGAYEDMVSRAQLMSQTRFEGNPVDALRERARAMNFPLRHLDDLTNAFNAEPGDTEWDLLNAFTRVGTHTALPGGLGRRVMHAAGDWAYEFDIVTARLPRPMANRVGAQIIEAINEAGE